MTHNANVVVVTPNLARLPSLRAWLDEKSIPWLQARSPHELEVAMRCIQRPHLVIYDVTTEQHDGVVRAEEMSRDSSDPFVVTSAEPVPAQLWSEAIYGGIEDVMVEPYTVDEADMVFDRASRPQIGSPGTVAAPAHA